MAGRRKDEELVVITKTYDLILWSCNHTGKYPRNHRFVLGERIEQRLYDLLDSLIEAKYSRVRLPLQRRANLQLEIITIHTLRQAPTGFTPVEPGFGNCTGQSRRRQAPRPTLRRWKPGLKTTSRAVLVSKPAFHWHEASGDAKTETWQLRSFQTRVPPARGRLGLGASVWCRFVVLKPLHRWHRASGVSMLLAPTDPASVEPRFGHYKTQLRGQSAPIGFTPMEPGFDNYGAHLHRTKCQPGLPTQLGTHRFLATAADPGE